MVYIHTEILFSIKKEGNTVIHYNMDEPWGHYAKWNKFEVCPQKTNNAWFQLYEVSKLIIFIESESRMWLPGAGGEGEMGSFCWMGIEFQFFKIKKF